MFVSRQPARGSGQPLRIGTTVTNQMKRDRQDKTKITGKRVARKRGMSTPLLSVVCKSKKLKQPTTTDTAGAAAAPVLQWFPARGTCRRRVSWQDRARRTLRTGRGKHPAARGPSRPTLLLPEERQSEGRQARQTERRKYVNGASVGREKIYISIYKYLYISRDGVNKLESRPIPMMSWGQWDGSKRMRHALFDILSTV